MDFNFSNWPMIAYFVLIVAYLSTFVITVAVHFPKDVRPELHRGILNTLVIWGTIFIAGMVAVLSVGYAVIYLQWFSVVLGSGITILIAPYLLHPFPDKIMNGRTILVIYGIFGILAAMLTIYLISTANPNYY